MEKSMPNRVVITGLGCISPLGNDVPTTWKNLLAGVSGADRITYYSPSEIECQIAAEVKHFDGVEMFGPKEARRMDRSSQYVLAAALQAIEDAGLRIDDSNRDQIGAVIGTGIGGIGTTAEQFEVYKSRGPSRVSPFLVPMMLPDTPGSMIAINLGIKGINLAIVTACASGSNAMGEAANIIHRGQVKVVLAGGTEAAIVQLAMAGLKVMGALSSRYDSPSLASRPFDKERDGFVMGEGSAVLVLESLDYALARNARILAEVSGYGSTNDAFHISAPAENGAGAAVCMQMALADAHLNLTEIDYINAHGTSTILNDKSETAAIKTVFGEQAYNVPISSTKSMTGHLLGAAGALEAIFCVKTIQDEVLPPTINYEHFDPACDLDYVPNSTRSKPVRHVMSNSFGFGGHNASIILSKYSEV
jgi:3-oxoacyl-[acyl-carrier-protein] synthase II